MNNGPNLKRSGDEAEAPGGRSRKRAKPGAEEEQEDEDEEEEGEGEEEEDEEAGGGGGGGGGGGRRRRAKRKPPTDPQDFIDALMGAEIKKLEGCPDIGYLEDIPVLRGRKGDVKTIVLTKEVKQFWKACLRWSRTYRVCAVGSPGAGKSTTMMYLIRILLERGKKVVYLHRTEEKDSHYYVWTKTED